MKGNEDNPAFIKLRERAKKSDEIMKKASHLSTAKHGNHDFFIADMFNNSSFKDHPASMEYPIFALKTGDTRTRTFEHNNCVIEINPTRHGIATIHDKDIWIYCISKLIEASNKGEEISRTVRFTIYDYLITTNRTTSGRDYERTKDALERLAGTRITTNIENETRREASNFGLVESWRIVEEKDGCMVRVEVILPTWLYKSIASKNVLTISPEYFRLRKPIDRRVYEIARKHCGNQRQFKISLDLLHKKSGSTRELKKFRADIKSLAASNELPDYSVSFDLQTDFVTFKNRNPKALIKELTKR